jgi:hypothetical protein
MVIGHKKVFFLESFSEIFPEITSGEPKWWKYFISQIYTNKFLFVKWVQIIKHCIFCNNTIQWMYEKIIITDYHIPLFIMSKFISTSDFHFWLWHHHSHDNPFHSASSLILSSSKLNSFEKKISIMCRFCVPNLWSKQQCNTTYFKPWWAQWLHHVMCSVNIRQ